MTLLNIFGRDIVKANEGQIVCHNYNTRSRSRTNLIDEIQMSPRRLRNRSLRSIPSCSPCRIQEPPFYCKHLTKIIVSVMLVLIGAIFYYHTTTQEFHVQSHINMIEKQLSEIATSLPVFRRIANNIENNVQRCSIAKDSKRQNENLEHIRVVVRDAIDHYNADKTGKPDYALESAGGTVISTRDTEPYNRNGKALSLFGIPLCASSTGPNALIQPGVMPGECWAFKGPAGTAVIRLVTKIYVTGVSVEHIPRSISPDGETNTAPKEFSIWGLQTADDEEGFFFGKYTYDTKGTIVQHFPIVHKPLHMYDIIEFKVYSNHGHSEYTCIYRLRVHGDLEKKIVTQLSTD